MHTTVVLMLGLALVGCSAEFCEPDSLSWMLRLQGLPDVEYTGARDIAVDGAGDVYVTGHFIVNATYGFLLAKYAPDGTRLWIHTPAPEDLLGTSSNGVAVDGAGDVFVTGILERDMFLAKYEPDGIRQWLRQFGTTDAVDFGVAVTVDEAGDVYVAGVMGADIWTQSGEGSDMFVTKYGPSGTQLWTRQLGTSAGLGVAVDGMDGVYVSGTTSADLDGNVSAGGSDTFVTKYDSDGVKHWTRQLGSEVDDRGGRVAVDHAGEVYVTGATGGDLDGNISAGGDDVFVTKYGADGTKRWTRQLGSSEYEATGGLAVDSANNIYVTGSSKGSLDGNASAGDAEIFVTQYGPDGSRRWTQLLGFSGTDSGVGVAVDGDGIIYVAGEQLMTHELSLARVCTPR